jgi:hypothetical protein
MTCGAVLRYGDDTLHCDLPQAHVEPRGGFPQGDPHQTSEHLDALTGDPFAWWV